MRTACSTLTGCLLVYIALAGLLLFAVSLYSYADAAEALTLDQAVETALKNNPGLKAADAQAEAARAVVSRAQSGYLPRLTASETYVKSNNPLMVLGTKLNQEIMTPADFDPAVMNNPGAMGNYNTRFALMQPVFSGGKVYFGVKQAKLGSDAAAEDRERDRQETVFNVIKGYYGLLLAKESLAVALQSRETSEANVKLADARYRAGAVLQSDLLRAKVQLAEVKEMVTRAGNGVKLATAGLNFAMGVPQSAEYDVGGSLAAQQAPGVLDALVRDAESRRPDLASIDLNRKGAEAGVNQARGDYLPTVSVMGQTDWNSKDIAGSDATSWTVMAVFQWNLFEGLVTRARVREALATSDRMRFLEEQTRSQVELQVRQAYYDLDASLDRIDATSSSVQEAEEGLRIVQRRYEAGMTTFVDVLNAETALIRARNNAIQALYDNNIAAAQLKLASGTL